MLIIQGPAEILDGFYDAVATVWVVIKKNVVAFFRYVNSKKFSMADKHHQADAKVLVHRKISKGRDKGFSHRQLPRQFVLKQATVLQISEICMRQIASTLRSRCDLSWHESYYKKRADSSKAFLLTHLELSGFFAYILELWASTHRKRRHYTLLLYSHPDCSNNHLKWKCFEDWRSLTHLPNYFESQAFFLMSLGNWRSLNFLPQPFEIFPCSNTSKSIWRFLFVILKIYKLAHLQSPVTIFYPHSYIILIHFFTWNFLKLLFLFFFLSCVPVSNISYKKRFSHVESYHT